MEEQKAIRHHSKSARVGCVRGCDVQITNDLVHGHANTSFATRRPNTDQENRSDGNKSRCAWEEVGANGGAKRGRGTLADGCSIRKTWLRRGSTKNALEIGNEGIFSKRDRCFFEIFSTSFFTNRGLPKRAPKTNDPQSSKGGDRSPLQTIALGSDFQTSAKPFVRTDLSLHYN